MLLQWLLVVLPLSMLFQWLLAVEHSLQEFIPLSMQHQLLLVVLPLPILFKLLSVVVLL
jgi:hypothetical protein